MSDVLQFPPLAQAIRSELTGRVLALPDNALLTKSELAHVLGKSEKTIERSGLVPGPFGMYRWADVAAFVSKEARRRGVA